jgi:hypothetical protein
MQARLSALMADRFASGLRLGCGPEIRLMPFGFHLPMDTLPSRIMRAGRSFPTFVYASPLRGCGGTFTRKRSALLGAHPKSEAGEF